MVQAQGVRQFDPYRCLQVGPQAPRELIIEAYWSLVSRSRRSDLDSAAGAQRTHEMSTAYALLMDDTRRRAYDATGGAATDSRRKNEQPGHYDALCIDPGADLRIIELAHRLLSREEHRRKNGVRQLTLDEAYRVLSNPQLRAQYDATRDLRAEPVRPALVNVNATPQAAHPKETEKARSGFLGLRRTRPAPPPDARDERLLTLRESALNWDVAQKPEDEPAEAPQREHASAEIVFVAGAHAGRRIAFDGRTVSFGGSREDDVMLERGAPQSCLAFWEHGERYMMRHALEADVTIGGRPLALPIVTLDDGDEISLGSHKMRFRRIPDA